MEKSTLKELENLTLDEMLEEKLIFFQVDEIAENVRIVFWKENKKWHTYCFCIQKDNTILFSNLKILRWIESVDEHAVVMRKRDFAVLWTDNFITMNEMVYKIERQYDGKECHNTIDNFLKNYIKVQGLLEFNQEQFFQTELGKKLIDTINHFKAEMLTDDPHIERFQAIIDTIFLALKQFYNVDCSIVLRENGYDIVANDVEDLIYKCKHENERSNHNEIQ